jgi:predicted transcriptional regulator
MEAEALNVVKISVSSIDDANRRFEAAFRGEEQGSHISFASFELLWRVLAPKRMEIVQAMTGAGPIAIREVARRVKRDVKAVHGDVQALLKAGVVDKTDEGLVVFPYDSVHFDFVVEKAVS